MYQNGRLLVNSGRSGKSLNINNVGVSRIWVLLDSQSRINVFFNRDMLTEVDNMEGLMSIHCNECVVCRSFDGVIPGFEQNTTW